MMTKNESCATCRFWLPPAPKLSLRSAPGTCHRAPPVVLPSGSSKWPEVAPLDWCALFANR